MTLNKSVLLQIIKVLVLFYFTFVCLVLVISLTSVELNYKFQNYFFPILSYGIPLIVMLSLFLTYGSKNKYVINLFFLIITPILAVILHFIVSLLFVLFGNKWVDFTILYVNQKDANFTIKEQLFDTGATGYSQKRIVKVDSFLMIFQKVEEVDTNRINKHEWKFVNIDGEIKTP